jgi:hypothetical protein
VQHRASAGLDVEQQQQQQQQQQPLLATHLEPVGSSGASSDGCHHRPQELQLHLSQQKDDEQLASLPLAARASRADDRDHTGDPVVEQSACLPQGTCSSAQSPAALLVVVLGLVLTCVSDPGVLSELQVRSQSQRWWVPTTQLTSVCSEPVESSTTGGAVHIHSLGHVAPCIRISRMVAAGPRHAPIIWACA